MYAYCCLHMYVRVHVQVSCGVTDGHGNVTVHARHLSPNCAYVTFNNIHNIMNILSSIHLYFSKAAQGHHIPMTPRLSPLDEN